MATTNNSVSILIVSIFLFYLATTTMGAAPFVAVRNPFPWGGNYYSNNPQQASWGDFNNDGLLDLAITATENATSDSTFVYRNDGSGKFTELQGGLSQMAGSTAQWGDFDNDNVLDLLIAGDWNSGLGACTTPESAHLYKGNGTGGFTLVASFAGYCGAAGAWGDFNNDGWEDIILVGGYLNDQDYAPKAANATIWLNNNGDGSFTPLQTPSGAHVGNSDVCLGDYDNDGWLDILVMGFFTTGEGSTILLHNDGVDSFNPTFTEVATPFFEVGFSSCTWIDVDADGWLDLIVGGGFMQAPPPGVSNGTSIYRNLQNNAGFASAVQPIQLMALFDTIRWGDVNNDGLPDLCITSRNQIILNNASGFELNPAFLWPASDDGTCQFGDYDNDGRLDFFTITEYNNSNSILFHNVGFSAGSAPAPPTNSSYMRNGSYLVIDWLPPTGASGALSYNVAIQNPNDINTWVVSPQAMTDGKRLVARMGNAQARTSFWVRVDQYQPYEISIQTVDAAFRGSTWVTVSVPALSSANNVQSFAAPLWNLILNALC